jgi:DNA (cytosine-5)-methyltransferase 1
MKRIRTLSHAAPLLRHQLSAISLFSGAGGFCEGVRLAGYKLLCAVEADVSACRTHRANFPEVRLFQGDIKRFLVDKVAGAPTSDELFDVDLVYGGPPCQGFSQIGPRDESDPRNLLYKEFVRVVATLNARSFVMENVPNILAMSNGHYRDAIIKSFADAGYQRTVVVTLIASDFGVPQDRRRVFFIGLRDDLPFEEQLERMCLQFFASHRSERQVRVSQALFDLPCDVAQDDGVMPYPRRPGRYSDYQQLMRLDFDSPLLSKREKNVHIAGEPVLYNHHTKGIEDRRRRIIAAIKPGRRGDSLPSGLWSGTRAHKWRRLDPSRPSYTILAQMHRDLSEWIHPKYDRWITVREAARLQSFHDGFVFCGSEYQQLKQVGNAVPPLLALAVARVMRKLLSRVGEQAQSVQLLEGAA